MKKITLLLTIILIASLQSFCQLNPINNLYWNHWYVCPNNYFILTWGTPDPGSDTLMGYNVYRNNELYRFQTETILNHEEYGGNCNEDFIAYNSGDFWIHVTALYNSSYEESIYLDSAYCDGILIGVNEKQNLKKHLYPNPSYGIVHVSLPDVKIIYIADQTGRITRKINNDEIIDLRSYPQGIYYIRLITDRETYCEKVLLK